MLMYSGLACLKHSNFLKVKYLSPKETVKASEVNRRMEGPRCNLIKRAMPPCQKSNYELFNCNNFNIRYWSWNYRGCWHQTCPPIDPR